MLENEGTVENSPEILKDGKREQLNGEKSPKIIKDRAAESHMKS